MKTTLFFLLLNFSNKMKFDLDLFNVIWNTGTFEIEMAQLLSYIIFVACVCLHSESSIS